jgi:hypothetical protein
MVIALPFSIWELQKLEYGPSNVFCILIDMIIVPVKFTSCKDILHTSGTQLLMVITYTSKPYTTGKQRNMKFLLTKARNKYKVFNPKRTAQSVTSNKNWIVSILNNLQVPLKNNCTSLLYNTFTKHPEIFYLATRQEKEEEKTCPARNAEVQH